MFNEFGNGIIDPNNSSKINEFPMPFELAQMFSVMLTVHSFITPLMRAALSRSSVIAGAFCFVVTFSFWSMNCIAMERENRFGDDAKDLHLKDMQCDMNGSIATLLSDRALYPPNFA